MAEQISTIIDKSKLVGGEVINEQILESQEEEKNKEKETEVISETLIDKSKLVGGEKVEEPTQITFTTDSIIDKSKLVGGENVITGEEYTEPTNLERLEYGWDKETMVLGNVFRIGKAKVQDLFDDDKSFKDYILENEKKRLEALDKEHWKFRGREDEGGITTVGSIASMILDPYYLAGYLNPVSLKAMTNPVSAGTLNALLISGDVIIDNLAKTGEVDWGSVALSGATAGAIGAVIPIGGNIIKKYAPKFIESEVKLVADFIDRKLAKSNNISISQLKKIQNVSKSAQVKAADNELIKWTRNFVHPITAETKKFRALEKTLLEKRNLLIKIRKLKGKKKPIPGKLSGMLTQESPGKQIINIRQQIIDAKKASEAVKKNLITKQQGKLENWAELISNRNVKILEQLRKNETTIDWAARSLFSVAVRPLVGAGMGTVGGILFGDEETDLMYWATAGAVAGQMQKMIARSAKFGTKLEKGKILGVIDRELTQLTLQKVRDLMSATSATKLDSYGGATREIGKMLFREVDSPVSQKSAIAIADQMQRHFFRKVDKIFKPYNNDEIAWAISINRGKQLTKETPKRVEELSIQVKNYIDEFKNLSEGAGFFPKKEIDDYFPRVLDWDAIKKDEKAFLKTVQGIYESLGMKGKVASGPNKGRLRSEVAAESYYAGHKTSGDSVFNAQVLKEMFEKSTSGVSKSGKKFIYAPVSEHIIHQRALQGPYKLVEEVLEKKGYLVNDGKNILTRIANDSVKSIAFARQFGTHGELLQPFFQRIKDKYLKSGLTTEKALTAANQEMKLVVNSIDAYFDRYGVAMTGAAKSSAGIIATLGNANMLGRVTISSLGDIIQPLQNSSNWTVILNGFRRTAIRQAKETGPARELGLDISNSIQQGLQRSAGFEGKNLLLNNSWMGKTPTETVNNIMFKALGLQWLTGYARRFAYNVGVSDAYYLSKTLKKLTARGLENSGKAKRIKFFLNNNYEITTRQALQLGSAKNFDDAILNKLNKKAINDAGVKAANRDALIPQADNRLLFTQSNNQWVRLMGQFLSWAQAKSAQTNKILMRIENGSAKTLIKTLAVLPVYSGVQSLREIAKYGEIITDYDANNNRWWAEGARLSGMFGFLPELIANRFIGPGAREPWYLFAPAFTIIGAPGRAAKQFWDGDTDKALVTLNEKFFPLPNWRRRLWQLFTSGPQPLKIKGTTMGSKLKWNLGGLVLRKRFKKGDAVEAAAMEDINLNKQEDMNIKDLANVAAAATIATTGVNADINKAAENNILPPSIVEEQILPEEKPLYAEGAFVDYIEQVENPNLKYGMIHKSAEGGNDTIAFGHKLTDKEIKDNKVYGYNLNELTEKNAKHILLLDLQKADEQLQEDYGEKYNKLDKKRKQMLIDFQYNMGSGGVKKFKNFKEGLFSNDINKMKEEYERGFTNEEGEFKKLTNRNKEFFNYFFSERKKLRVGGDPSVRYSDIAKLDLDKSTDESAISQVPNEIDKMIDQKEAQKMMTDDSSMHDKLDKDIQKLKELKNEQLVAV